MSQPYIRRCVKWLMTTRTMTEAGGRVGILRRPYFHGVGPSTASQTAWALLALISAGDHECEAALRGIYYLTRPNRTMAHGTSLILQALDFLATGRRAAQNPAETVNYPSVWICQPDL
ncbi:MAG: hypothetical protein Ct9H300mP11_19850 [Chloroflexota bacterium]|nr:MAG: hypothetical protein Ct9H300mP11_19850 [Chloroflexota bacterium]